MADLPKIRMRVDYFPAALPCAVLEPGNLWYEATYFQRRICDDLANFR
jgi:hypothetical protein